MKHYTRLLLALLAFTLVVAACDSGDPDTQGGPTAPPTANDAESTARSFLDGWVNNDYQSMYGLLSAKAQLIPLDSKDSAAETFTKIYKDVNQTLQIAEDDHSAKSYEIYSDLTERDGNTAVVSYSVTFNSKLVGSFTDGDRNNPRLMHLILADGKWRVAWSTMDIFEGMAGGAKLSDDLTQSDRGEILDRNGDVIAQDGVKNYAARLLPGKYPAKPEDCFRTLGEVFGLRGDDLVKLYGLDQFTPAQYGNYGFTIGTLSEGDYERVKPELDAVCGMKYQEQTTRYYYGGSFAQQTVGYLSQPTQQDLAENPGMSSSALVGHLGVEQQYQQQLAGTSGADLQITSPDGILIRDINSKKPGATENVTLTLDRDLQLATERAIGSAYNFANWAQYSTGAAAVVLDVHTGQILALASYPTINPDVFRPNNTFDVQTVLNDYSTRRATFNRATQETYAAGSVFKIVSMAAAADTKTVGINDIYVCTGVWDGTKYGDIKRLDWIYTDKYHQDKPYHDAITLIQGLTASCDAYFWDVGYKLDNKDPQDFQIYGNKMGLGVPTGIDSFLQEQPGQIPSPKTQQQIAGRLWGLGDSLNTVIGQGDVKVTAIQIARMMMGVANGGTLYHPYVVKSVGATPTPPQAPDQMGIDPTVLKGIQQGLCGAVSDPKLGTANFVFAYDWDPTQITVCGKTGTAQTGSPYPNGWFAAYVGKTGQQPDLAIAVITEHSREGSETSGPIVRRIIESYYKLSQEPWPNYWTGAYDPMADPNASDGGPAVSGPPTTKK